MGECWRWLAATRTGDCQRRHVIDTEIQSHYCGIVPIRERAVNAAAPGIADRSEMAQKQLRCNHPPASTGITLETGCQVFLRRNANLTTPPTATSAHPLTPPPPRVVASEQLLQGAVELHILHGGTIYRLRVTQNGKLILCK